MKKILMVCLGNICRSPLAEGILKAKLPKDFEVDSCGTGNWHVGNPPDHRSIAVAKENGLDISTQKCRQINREDFTNFDLILVMDDSNLTNVKSLSEEKYLHKIHKITTYAGVDTDLVVDPYRGNLDDFRKVYTLLDKACENIKNKLTLAS